MGIKPNKRDVYFGNPFEEGSNRLSHGGYGREYERHVVLCKVDYPIEEHVISDQVGSGPSGS